MTLRSIFQRKKSRLQSSKYFEPYQGGGSQRPVNQLGNHNGNPGQNKNQQKPGGGYDHYAQPDLSQLYANPSVLVTALERVPSRSQHWKQQQREIIDTEVIDFNSNRKRENNTGNQKRVRKDTFQLQLSNNEGQGSPGRRLYNYTDTSQYQLQYQQQQQQQQQLLDNAVGYLQGLSQLAQYLQNSYSGAAKNPIGADIIDYSEQSLQNAERYWPEPNMGSLSRSDLALVLRALVCLISFCSSPFLGVLVVMSCFWPEECAEMILTALMTGFPRTRTDNKANERNGVDSKELVAYWNADGQLLKRSGLGLLDLPWISGRFHRCLG